ncbi:probable glycosyl transferase [Erythrobacter sp. NAP1]|uniref:glycosyltransferase family 2 protein n=1 Tax=Erythrobacter sp. NAP1 TaxID=237727 RepID=UPI000068783A|nr:glycosyltransferase family 2 protein [Erythrobacter sp. NAP1]EAQ28466.1 probable glycosyl transferase [Erythrobacter sp. NAP1]
MSNDIETLVSIITPAYKAERVIGAAIGSVQSQTHENWEMLIAEDCGPDNTRQCVRAFASMDRRVKLIEPDRNGGPAAARNHALAHAKGRWIAFLDSDDMWLPLKLERQLEFHRSQPDAVLSYTGFRRVSDDASRTGSYISVPGRLTYRGLLGNTAIATSSVLVDRALSGQFAMRHTYYDDFACWLSLLKKGGMAVGLDEDLMRYRVMDASVSRDKRKSAAQVWRAYREIEQLGPLISAWYFSQYAARALHKYRQF